MVRVTLANPSMATIRVLSWRTPADGLTAPLFHVTRDGGPVAYTGILAKRAAPTAADYVVLAPGEQRVYTVDLAQSYSFDTTGTYAIRYAAASTALYLAGTAAKRSGTLTSSATYVAVVGRPDTSVPAPALEATSIGYTGCSGTEQTGLIAAVASASTYADQASAYFGDNRAGARYRLWFGTYDDARWTAVKSHYAAISTALSTAALQLICNNACSTDPNVYAFVYANAPYAVYLCGAFWGAPNTGTDSRAGTLIHELSHFTVVAGTSDYVYGQPGAKSLAISNPTQAIENADNHEYFAENTPATPDNAAAYTLTATAHDFGTVSTGSTSGDYTVVLTSTGDIDVTLGTLSTTGDFALTGGTCSGATLAPAAACTFTAIFSPSATGPRTGSISLPGNAVAAPTAVALSGTGLTSVPVAAYTLSATELAFGDQTSGTRSAHRVITITSIGSADLVFGSLPISGEFRLASDTCSGATLPTSANCTFAVDFAPTSAGAKSGSVTLPSNRNGGGGPASIALSGNGIAAAVPVDPTPAPIAPAAEPTEQRTPATSVTAKAVRGAKLRVAIAPRDIAWTFTIQRRRNGGGWVVLKGKFTVARGTASRTIDLPAGTYRVVLGAQPGHAAAVSTPATLQR